MMKAVIYQMKKLFHNRIIKNYLLMFLTLFAVEVIFRAVLKMPLIDWSLLRIFVGINVITMILSIIFSVFLFLWRLVAN